MRIPRDNRVFLRTNDIRSRPCLLAAMKQKTCPISIGMRILDTFEALHIFGNLPAQWSEVSGRRGPEFETPEKFVVFEPFRVIGSCELCAFRLRDLFL